MSKSTLTDIINSFNQTFFQISTEGNFIFIEDQNLLIPQSYLNQSILQLITEHERIPFSLKLREISKELRPLELNLIFGFPSQSPAELSLSPYFKNEKTVINGRLTLIDKKVNLNQNQERVDWQIKENEERFRLAFESSNDGIWDWNLETDEVFFSKRWKSIVGYEEHEVVHNLDGFDQLLHPEDRALTYERVNEFINKKIDKYEVKFRMKHKEGHFLHILSKALVIRDPKTQKAVRMVGIHEDITERVLAKKALTISEEKYKFLVENIDLPISQYDRDGNVLFFNNKAGLRLGGIPKDFIGKNIKDLFPEKKADFYLKNINKVLENKTIDTREEFFKLSEGSSYWYQTTLVPVINSENKSNSVLVISHDVTELRESTRQKEALQRVLDTAFESSPVGLIIANAEDGKIQKINKAALNIL
ncbi:MAG: PAS domain S-box protein, partial [Flammeovirgaceae bacterium]|nr:PAS domain S-box protein [Flammeovirgaceae bacterium]